jgi:hypothetical protein
MQRVHPASRTSFLRVSRKNEPYLNRLMGRPKKNPASVARDGVKVREETSKKRQGNLDRLEAPPRRDYDGVIIRLQANFERNGEVSAKNLAMPARSMP